MKKINFPIILSFITALFVLISCGKDDNDNSPPEISIQNSTPNAQSTEVCGHFEEQVFQLYSGDSLELLIRIEDNEQLSQIKFDIHNNFDCHGHGGGQAPGFDPPDVSNLTEDWTLLDIIDLEGNSKELNVALPVPANVTTGIYHLGMQAVDASGNESSNLIYDLKVYNKADTVAPEIMMESPQSMQLQLTKGESVTFEGKITDNRSLENGGNAIVYLTYENLESENHFTGPHLVFQAGTGMEGTFSFEFAFPQTVVEGDYKLYLNAHDGVRNAATPIAYDIQVSN